MTAPLVTVVVPAFNRLHLVSQVLDGFARQQTKAASEVILVDDGSEPPAVGVITGRDGRFRILRQPNRGRASAINAGLAAARGQILIVCDSDIVPTPGFIDEHVAFHSREHAVEDTHLGGLNWGITPIPFAALLGPRANPRMVGLEGEVPWTLWYTDNWSFKRQLFDAGIVRFDEAFHLWGWEDLELGHRLATLGIRNVATAAACGLHLQCATLDGMLKRFAGSVPNLLHLANCVFHDETVDRWLEHRHTSVPLVDAGERILRDTVQRLESSHRLLGGLESSLYQEVCTRLSHAVFRCGMQRGFLQADAVPPEQSAGDQLLVETAILPYADLVRTVYVALQAFGMSSDAQELADHSIRTVNEMCKDAQITARFVSRVVRGSRASMN